MSAVLVMLDDLIDQFSAPELFERQTQRKFVECDEKISRFINAKCSAIAEQRQCHLLFVAGTAIHVDCFENLLFIVQTERSSHVWGTAHSQSDNDVKAIIYYPQVQTTTN